MFPWQQRPPQGPHQPAESPAPAADAEPPVPPDFDTPTERRVKFARWLYQRGRLSDWGDTSRGRKDSRRPE